MIPDKPLPGTPDVTGPAPLALHLLGQPTYGHCYECKRARYVQDLVAYRPAGSTVQMRCRGGCPEDGADAQPEPDVDPLDPHRPSPPGAGMAEGTRRMIYRLLTRGRRGDDNG